MGPGGRRRSSQLNCHSEPLRLRLYGVYSSFFEKLKGTWVEGHRLTSAARRTDSLRPLPTHTSNVDEESRGRDADRRFTRKLTLVCATPASFIHFFLGGDDDATRSEHRRGCG